MTSITGLILAGGQSTRMSGLAGEHGKALLPLQGRPMIEHVVARLSPQVERIVINANTNAFAQLPFPVIADAIADFPGPLAGLHAGLSFISRDLTKHDETPLLVCVPCDAPLMPLDLVSRLHAALDDADIAVARTADGLQPTFMLCRATLAASIDRYLAGGGRALHQWLAQQRCIEVDFYDSTAFSNINTPEDVARYEKSKT